MSFSLLLCCALLWSVNVNAQNEVATVAKSDGQVKSTSCKSATATVATKSATCQPASAVASKSVACRPATAVAANTKASPVHYLASPVALLGSQFLIPTAVPSNCKSAKGDVVTCKPANCDPEDCPQLCKILCKTTCADAGAAKTAQKL